MLPPVPTGFSKVFYVIGLGVAFTGLAIMFYAIGTTLADGFRLFSSESPDPEMMSFARVARWLPVALGMAVPGSIIMGLASAIGPHPRASSDTYIDRGIFHAGGGDVNLDHSMNDHTHINAYFASVALNEIQALRTVVSGMDMSKSDTQDVLGCLSDASREIHRREPDVDVVSERLMRATRLLGQTGALARNAEELVPRLTHLASLLGSAGSGLLRLLA